MSPRRNPKMFAQSYLKELQRRREQWEKTTLRESLRRFKVEESPNQFYSPLDVKEHDFLDEVGFPGEYPYTAGKYASSVPGSGPVKGGGYIVSGGGLIRSGRYSGYGTAEDTRDYYQSELIRGRQSGPNLAFDLPTQLGYDSDHPISRGEVGKTGVAIDTLNDMETIYQAFTGEHDLDKIASNFTINAPCNVILAMYIALSEQRRIPLAKLRGTPQNDILKEFISRGTYIFPPKPSMRMVKDTITYCTKNMPLLNTISICGYHMREQGATRVQTLGFTMANAIAYVQLGLEAGLEVDDFVPRFTFLDPSGSMEMLKEIALRRAHRRMYARIMKEKFKAKDPRNWRLRDNIGPMSGCYTMTVQRPLNNLTRAIIGGVAAALSMNTAIVEPPYDEPLGLGWSLEAQQLSEDAARIIQYEAKLCDVIDPLAGSYYIESLTDEIEEGAWAIVNKVEELGGAVAAIEKGFPQKEIAQSAYQYQKEVETGERIIVGVNRFTGEHELEVNTTRLVQHPYDPEKRAKAEEKQITKLEKIKKERDNHKVEVTLKELKEACCDENTNLIPTLVGAVKAYATIGEICGVLRDIFGEYRVSGAL